jgi:copper(I)-binding protein
VAAAAIRALDTEVTMSERMSTRSWPAVAVVAAAMAVGGCGDETPDVDDSGAVGPDAAASDAIEVVQVQLEYPVDGVYEEGEDARLFLGITNDGTESDGLVDVRGPDFADAELVAAGSRGEIPIPAKDNVYVGAEGAPSVLLDDLRTSLRSSESIPVTFVFDEAGEVTVEAMVAAQGEEPLSPFDFEDPADDPST